MHLPATKNQGFTLIEILVAMGIFAIMATIAYGGLHEILNTSKRLEEQATRMGEVQKAFLLIERDLQQVLSRSVRDAYGTVKPAFLREEGLVLMEFSRAGWSNPLDRPRSNLQRIQYTLDEDHQLIRHVWWVLDQAQDSVPYEQPIMKSVTSVEIRILDWKDQWTTDWPTSTMNLEGQALPKLIPKAVEITVETEDMGKIRRLIPLPRGVTS